MADRSGEWADIGETLLKLERSGGNWRCLDEDLNFTPNPEVSSAMAPQLYSP